MANLVVLLEDFLICCVIEVCVCLDHVDLTVELEPG